eukprot:scaffold281093_cov30-Tisochrysis_lutea.AAC.2
MKQLILFCHIGIKPARRGTELGDGLLFESRAARRIDWAGRVAAHLRQVLATTALAAWKGVHWR